MFVVLRSHSPQPYFIALDHQMNRKKCKLSKYSGGLSGTEGYNINIRDNDEKRCGYATGSSLFCIFLIPMCVVRNIGILSKFAILSRCDSF